MVSPGPAPPIKERKPRPARCQRRFFSWLATPQRWTSLGLQTVLRMNRYEFQLRVRPEKYLGYYRGKIQQVVVRCTTGQTVQFPASLLQKFVPAEGISGRFVLTSDANHKIIGLERVAGAP